MSIARKNAGSKVAGSGRVYAENWRAYRKAGWLPIPVCCSRCHCWKWPDCGGKHPLAGKYHGPQTEAQYREWEQRFAKADIGVVFPAGTIGADIDHYGIKRGLDTLRELEDEAGEKLPDGPVTTSKANGSGIRTFRLPDGYQNGEVKWPSNLKKLVEWQAGFDILHPRNRFAMAWPSKHPGTGAEYRWSTGEIPRVDSLPVLPVADAEIIASLASNGPDRETEDVSDVAGWLEEYADPDGEPCDRTQEVLQHWIEEIQDGDSHDSANAGIHALLGELAEGHSGVYSALGALRSEFKNARKERGGKERPEPEWQRMFTGLPKLDPDRDYPALDKKGKCSACALYRALRTLGRPFDPVTLEPEAGRLRPEPGHIPASQKPGSGLIRWGNEIDRKLTEWLWIKYSALGTASIIDGEKGVGKTSIVLDIGARVTSGAAMPDGSCVPGGSGNILVLSPENLLEATILPKLEAAGASMGKVAFPKKIRLIRGKAPEMYQLPGAAWKIADMIRAADARLAIIEPITAFLEPGVNSHNEASVRSAIAPLLTMLPDLRCALFLTRNMTKNTNTEARYRGSGSAGFSAVARVAMVAGRIPEDVAASGEFGLSQVDVNLTRIIPGTLTYDIVDSKIPADDQGNMIGIIKWRGMAETLSADSLIQRPKRHGPEPTRQEEIGVVFDKIFQEKDTWDSKEVMAILRAENVSTNRETIAKVMKARNIRIEYRHKEGGGFDGVNWTTRKLQARARARRPSTTTSTTLYIETWKTPAYYRKPFYRHI